MELTKQQIQFIDNYLIEQGVKYWDVRIELLDHVASKLEENENIELTRTYLLKTIGTKLMLEKFILNKRKNIHKKYRKQYYNEVISFFKNLKYILILALLLLLYFMVYSFFPYKTFKIVALVVFIFPAIVAFVLFSKGFLKKEKSIHLEYALFYITFSTGILQIFIQLANPKGIFEATIQTQHLVLLIIPLLNSFLTYCGFIVYKRTYKKYAKIYKQLI